MIKSQSNDLEDQEGNNEKYNLLSSGYQSPKLNLTSRCRLFMTQYERQIIRSLLSSNIQRIPFENSYLYLVNYDSELSIFKIQGDQITKSIQTDTFAAFVKIHSSSTNSKRIKSYLIDRNNIIYLYEIDFKKDESPLFRKEELEINQFLKLENSIFLSCFVNQNGSLLAMVSDTKIFFLQDDVIREIENPLQIKSFPYYFNFEQKVNLEFSADKKCFIIAYDSLVFIYENFLQLKKFELKNKQKVLNIKLFNNQLIILTNIAIIKIDNIFNEYIQLKDQDYFKPLDSERTIKYGTFEIENQEIKSVIIYDSCQTLYLIEMNSIQMGQMDIKEIKAQFKEDEKIQMIEVERKTNFFFQKES
ncbi:unnamed protein product [Paramecium primaurelia]|uniref:WD40-repeat-containing domain n=1 Tax=Paramecium primaurelia TaxID=5886 RepID=A0A8S1MRG4_PARPR|nr:unnamed protein product [Paramecium primaurelia]